MTHLNFDLGGSTLCLVNVTLPPELADKLGLRQVGDEAYLIARSIDKDGLVSASVESAADEAAEGETDTDDTITETAKEEAPGESFREEAMELGSPRAGELAGPMPRALKRMLGA